MGLVLLLLSGVVTGTVVGGDGGDGGDGGGDMVLLLVMILPALF